MTRGTCENDCEDKAWAWSGGAGKRVDWSASKIQATGVWCQQQQRDRGRTKVFWGTAYCTHLAQGKNWLWRASSSEIRCYCQQHLDGLQNWENKQSMFFCRFNFCSVLFLKYLLSNMCSLRASLVAQLVKSPPAMWESWVGSLGWEDPLEKEIGTHSSILALRIPWTVLSMGLQRVRHDWVTFTFTCMCSLIHTRKQKRMSHHPETSDILLSVIIIIKLPS